MLIKSCTNPNDDCLILFGGSGGELVLCQQLQRNFISCELQTDYYTMIIDRLNNNGKIHNKYKLKNFTFKNEKTQEPQKPITNDSIDSLDITDNNNQIYMKLVN